jgi:hypothetical protein
MKYIGKYFLALFSVINFETASLYVMTSRHFYPEDGSSMFLRNGGTHLLDCTVSKRRRPQYGSNI